MKAYNYLFIFFLCYTTTGFSQEVLRLNDGEAAGKAKLSDLAWLAGYWKGTGLGGDCEELWLPPIDSTMHGVFRFTEKGKTEFTEYMAIEQKDSTLSVKIKHFSRNLNPWEENEKWTQFTFIKMEKQTAYFNGITYYRKKNKLIVKVQLKSKEQYTTEEFVFTKSALSHRR